MASLNRVRVVLTGFPGAPGVATFYAIGVSTFIPALHLLWENMATIMPVDVRINIPPTGDIIESSTGVLTGTWSQASTAEIVGSSAQKYAAPVGILLRWTTDTILDGRHVRGRTFVVPVTNDQFDTNGQVAAGAMANFPAPLNALVSSQSANFVIWHRPRKARAANGTIPAVTARPGGFANVTGSGASPRAVVLRSRRD